MRRFLITLAILVFLIFVLTLTLFYIRKTTSVLPEASGNTSVISWDNSYVFASPVRALSGGDYIRVTVFVLDENGKGVSGKIVELAGDNEGLVINNIEETTDFSGKALFDVSSYKTGIYYLRAKIDGLFISQKVRVKFD